MRLFLYTITVFSFISALNAQENSGRANLSSSGGIFPLALVLEGVEHSRDAGAWRPDWPLELPPDSFKVFGDISKASVSGEGYELKLAVNPEGLVEEFPLMLNGSMTQVSLAYNDDREIRELTLAFASGEEPWEMEFLEYGDSFPVLVRGFRSNAWYFIYILWSENWVRESWYDEEGNFLGAYSFSFAKIGSDRRISMIKDFSNPGEETEFQFDSRGLVTEISFVSGLYKVLYFHEDLPRYLERRPVAGGVPETGNFTLQWSANGLLLRTSGETDFSNYRYEYTFDEWGNWIERREIRMIRSMDHLVPSQGTVFKRLLEYRNPL